MEDYKRVIIKALRCCTHRDCKFCPYSGKGIACKSRLMEDAAKELEKEEWT